MKPFPIPVVPMGPGSQIEDDTLDYMVMPSSMETYQPPRLPEREELIALDGAHQALHATLAALTRAVQGLPAEAVDLANLTPAERKLINQVMGEGEVSVKLEVPGGQILVQESVFAGVWRVIGTRPAADGGASITVSDRIEVGRIPVAVLEAAASVPAAQGRQGGAMRPPVVLSLPDDQPLPDGVMNAPSVLRELEDHVNDWRPGQGAHVLNFTLLPLSPQDLNVISQALGEGTILILSRGYGNCRIQNTAVPACWRVTYYNSQDAMILDTVEITDLPEVACAAPEDLADSHERLADMLQWIEAA